MRRRVRISTLLPFVILVGATLLQTTVAPYVKINGVHPDLVLVIVIAWGILRGMPDSFFWASVGGLSLDLISAAPFGIFTLALWLVTWLANTIHGRTFGSSIVLPLALTFPFSLLFNGLALFLRLTLFEISTFPVDWLRIVGDWSLGFSSVIVPVAIFNTGLMLLVFPLLYLLNRWLYPQPLSF